MNTNAALHINELRIGSIINGYKLTGGWHPFVVTGKDIAQFEREIAGEFSKNCPKGIDNIEPIPLTPEILEKCGFVKDDDGCLKLLNCLYWLDAGILQIAINYAPLINAPCKSLHQLQNLLFALTGEELTIQL